MKRLLALSLLGSSLLIGSNTVKADENYIFTYNNTTGLNELYKVTTNGESQSFSLITTKNGDVVDMRDGWFDASQNKFYFQESGSSNFQVYNLNNSSLLMLQYCALQSPRLPTADMLSMFTWLRIHSAIADPCVACICQ